VADTANKTRLPNIRTSPMHQASDSIVAYLRAKGGNKPHLLAQAFTTDASLVMDVKTGSIAFPPVSTGRDAIAQVLVRQFAQTYENVYTLCLSEPPASNVVAFSSDWLVVMSEKNGGAVRAGCGRYDWTFGDDSYLAQRLTITIETMLTLPAQALDSMTTWASKLPYPWCPRDLAMESAPKFIELNDIRAYVKRKHTELTK
jgi:hypothetical protein